MSAKDEINKAVGAHGMWKQRLHTAVESAKSEFKVAEVEKDNLCEFGKWIHGTSIPAAAKGLPDFAAVKDLHARFHKSAASVLALALAGNKAGAETAMGQSGEFAAISGDLTRAMMSWKSKVAD